MTLLESLAQSLLCRALARWRGSQLVLELPDGSRRRFGPADGREFSITVHRRRAFLRIVQAGTTGAGESYMDGGLDDRRSARAGCGLPPCKTPLAMRLDGPLSLGRRVIDLARAPAARPIRAAGSEAKHPRPLRPGQ